jgi:hypothetical protein
MHPLSVSIVILDGTLFATNFKPSISNNCSQGEKMFSSTSPRHNKKSEFSCKIGDSLKKTRPTGYKQTTR